MTKNKLLKIGMIGTLVSALCCFTPMLVIMLGALGLASFLTVADYVLLPSLALFIGITGYALSKSA